jgi:hypothetical protein
MFSIYRSLPGAASKSHVPLLQVWVKSNSRPLCSGKWKWQWGPMWDLLGQLQPWVPGTVYMVLLAAEHL